MLFQVTKIVVFCYSRNGKLIQCIYMCSYISVGVCMYVYAHIIISSYIHVHMGLPWWLSGKESACNAGDTEDMGLIPGLGRSLEKKMATHSSILAWKIPWTEEQATVIGSQRVSHDLATKQQCVHIYTYMLK